MGALKERMLSPQLSRRQFPLVLAGFVGALKALASGRAVRAQDATPVPTPEAADLVDEVDFVPSLVKQLYYIDQLHA